MNKLIGKQILAGALFLALLLPVVALAQNNPFTEDLDDVQGSSGLGSTELPQMIGLIINAVLTVLGVIFVVLVFYAGFLWMTDMGSEDKIKKAKAIIIAAVIGIVIVLAAYSITNFVLTRIWTATSSAA